MPNLYSAMNELKRSAELLIEAIANVESLEHSKYYIWNDFLIHLQQIWKKMYDGLSDIRSRSYPFLGNKSKEIKQSRLLNYFIHARNRIDHTTKPCIGTVQVSSSATIVGVWEYLDEKGNRIGEIKPIVGHPHRLKALTIVDKDGEFSPPVHYNGKRLENDDDPIVLAIIAIWYYFELLREVDILFNEGTLAEQFIKFIDKYNFSYHISKHNQTFYKALYPIKEKAIIKVHPSNLGIVNMNVDFLDKNRSAIESYSNILKNKSSLNR